MSSPVVIETGPDTADLITAEEQGPAGSRGPTPFVVVGEWEPTTAYTATPLPADAVRFGGGLYQCIESHTSGEEFDPTKWEAVIDPPPVYW